jgi:hypothetical protein
MKIKKLLYSLALGFTCLSVFGLCLAVRGEEVYRPPLGQGLPKVAGIDISQVKYLRAETKPDVNLERSLLQVHEVKDSVEYEKQSTYSYNLVDLNNDGYPEAFVNISSPGLCSYRGCLTYVLTSNGKDYQSQVLTVIGGDRTIITSNKTNGWNDLILFIDKEYYLFQFDGHKYFNTAVLKATYQINGKVVLASEDSHHFSF